MVGIVRTGILAMYEVAAIPMQPTQNPAPCFLRPLLTVFQFL